ncbi:MAG: gliding motility-associated ABC transporter substrate-binding protein GldG [Bacteroidetes bacterium]|nr:gliding motility-associated ABC transporter substrate-binding protein GldG [Bacteroidota bacterium]MBU1372747.1 gliding motility-associated ABC transporter substrate-binding protein GldG [Bacteroidota bacterium]MBU1484943.1 gliding motility-associated ABC transporter substrate-binding protein GldG [Bacteroidota bacterium]MBU1762247.1 gliding motility-associated ABC transporter substrate-binding protein GldG [Bacteroidota bacterium]MBU2047012.1 gliding motility-associated ABC transporter subs
MVNLQKKRDLTQLFIFLAAIIGINVLSNLAFTRFDFTKEKRYTISPITIQILEHLKEPVTIQVYLEGEFPSGFKRLRNATKDLLSDYKAYAGNKLNFEFIDPIAGKNQQEQEAVYNQMTQKGIEPTNLSVKTASGLTQKVIYPVAEVSAGANSMAVKLLQTRMGSSPEEVLNNSVQNLEYAFSSAIKKVSAGGKPRVGFTEGHGELSDLELQDALKSLTEGYEAGRINLNTMTYAGLDKLKVMVIAKPATEFSELEKYKIDQFLMHGGKIIWTIDQVNADLDSMRRSQGAEQLAFQKKLNLDDQLFTYGVRINYDLVGDMNCAQIPVSVGQVGGQAQIQMVPWLFFPLILPVSNHPMIKNLDAIKTAFVNTLDTIGTKGTQKTILLTTSPFNRELDAPTIISLDMIEDTPDPKRFQSVPKPVCVLLEGTFKSNFLNRAVPQGISDFPAPLEKSKFTKMLVFSDGDIFKNQISEKDGSAFPLGYDRYTQQTYGNKTFLLNAIDYLTDDSGLIALRSKEIKLRLLDKGKLVAQKTTWQLINTLIPLIMLVLFGIFQHIYRKRKYAA